MTEELKSAEVLIAKDEKTPSWGMSRYFKTQDGLKEKFGGPVPRVGFYAAFILMFVTAIFVRREPKSDSSSNNEGLSQPGLSYADLPITPPEIKTSTNFQYSQRVPGKARPQRIAVFNLRNLSDIPVGTETLAVLESGASNGIVKAKLVSALIVDGEPFLPEGTVIFGRGKSTEERLYVEFTKAIFRNGESMPIRAQALDESDKILGLKGSAVGTRSKKMMMAMGFGVVGGIAEGLQEDTSGSIFGIQKRKSLNDAALSGASRAALDQSQAYIDEMKNTANVIEVKQGTKFYLIIDERKEGKSD